MKKKEASSQAMRLIILKATPKQSLI